MLREVSGQVLNAHLTVSDYLLVNGPIQQSPVVLGLNSSGTGTDSVTIGYNLQTQGTNSVTVGVNASSSFANTICLNADNATKVTAGQASSLYINPVRGLANPGFPLLYYNPTSYEIVYGL